MSNGNWSVRFAALGAAIALAFVAFGTGVYFEGLNYPQQERYQSYRYAAEQPPDTDPAAARQTSSQALQNRTPCEQPKGHDESDLCAQWKAANAAEDSAFWAKWGFWIGVVGSCLLLWQIILTRRAVEDTSEATDAMREANEIARSVARNELRPYFYVVRVEICEMEGDEVSLKLTMKNYGRGPARNIRFFLKTYFTDPSFRRIEARATEKTNFGTVAPDAEKWFVMRYFINDIAQNQIAATQSLLMFRFRYTYTGDDGGTYREAYSYALSGRLKVGALLYVYDIEEIRQSRQREALEPTLDFGTDDSPANESTSNA